jgi:hypothetical protein
MAGAAIAVSALVTGTIGVSAGGSQAADGPPNVLALEFNEPAGASTAQDSSGLGHDGSIGSHVAMKSEADPLSPDGTGVTRFADFDRHPPGEGVDYGLDHLVVVPDAPNGAVDPRTSDFTLEVRFRTKDSFGNMIQKGQSKTPGGQVKVQAPGGRIQCMFKGSLGKATPGTGSKNGANAATFNDNRWHILRCVRTQQAVTLYIDGVRYGRINRATGNIDNNKPWTIGGKSQCDAVRVTCDYYPGTIDYVRMWRG